MRALAEVSNSCDSLLSPPGPPRLGEEARWTHVVSHLDPKYGGLSAAVPALGSAIAEASRFTVSINAFCHEREHFSPAPGERVDVRYMPLGRFEFWRDAEARRDFNRTVAGSAGVHIHGLWQHSTSAAAQAARTLDKPYVVSAHGMLERWALANKRLKKAVYAALFERRNLQRAACLHALTEAEADDYRRFGLPNPIAVIPNGVTIPSASSPERFLNQFPSLRGKRLVLFLGRIHFKKGLDGLCQAWAQVRSQWPDAHLVLAGPNSENTRSRIEALCGSLGITRDVTFTGMVSGELKWSALAAAECFILPSYSEGLSVSVLEAMGMGLPVIITEQCNLPEVAANDCGWVIQPRAEQIASALNSFLRASSSDMAQVGRNGRSLVDRRYTWPRVGEQMSSLYEWLLGGSVPSDIELRREGSQ
ncbi:MAG: glycosyltransferase [Acidobacteriota bacterium]|nr:glycosyltransferase [Acidobacteriota bacterium]